MENQQLILSHNSAVMQPTIFEEIECVWDCFICGENRKVAQWKEDKEIGCCRDCYTKYVHFPKSPNYKERVEKFGTDGQRTLLNRADIFIGLKEQEAEAKRIAVAYAEKLFQEPNKQQVNEMEYANKYIHMKLSKPDKRPEIITYQLARKFFWQFYCEIVWRESRIDLQLKASQKIKIFDGEVKIGSNELVQTERFIEAFVKYLIGEGDIDIDPHKSLYLWGARGVGKSTMAEVGHHLLGFCKNRYFWQTRAYEFISMDEVFMKSYTTQSLEKLNTLAEGSICMDELKLEHLTYKHFGNDLMLINDILTVRHNLWKREGHRTIITTNVSPAQLKANIDERLYDRMKQEYTFVEIRAQDKRVLTN